MTTEQVQWRRLLADVRRGLRRSARSKHDLECAVSYVNAELRMDFVPRNTELFLFDPTLAHRFAVDHGIKRGRQWLKRQYRKQTKRARGEEAWAAMTSSPIASPEEEAIVRRLGELVWPLVNQLPEPQRSVMLKRIVEGLSQRDIEEQTGVSRKRQKPLADEAIEKLRRQLGVDRTRLWGCRKILPRNLRKSEPSANFVCDY